MFAIISKKRLYGLVSLFILIFVTGLRSFFSRYLLLALLPFFILAGIGLARWKRIGYIIVFSILIFNIIYSYPILKARHDYNGYKNFGIQLNRYIPKNSTLIHFECRLVGRYLNESRKCKGGWNQDSLFERTYVTNMTLNSAYSIHGDAVYEGIALKKVAKYKFEDWHTSIYKLYYFEDILYEMQKS